jgi:hypothetical protein
MAAAPRVTLRSGSPAYMPVDWLRQQTCCSVYVRPVTLACIPTVVLAVYHAFAYASTHFSGTALWQQYGQPMYRVLVSRQRCARTCSFTRLLLVPAYAGMPCDALQL